MNELPDDLERALRALDAKAARRAAGVSAELVASRVLARLRAEGSRSPVRGIRPWGAAPRWVGLAAAALVVLFAGSAVTVLLRTGAVPAVPVPVVAQGLDSLDVTGLERVLRVTGQVRPQAVVAVQAAGYGTWDDLTEEQLRALLQAVQHTGEGKL